MKCSFIALFFFALTLAIAQPPRYNNFSLEIGYGIHVPVMPKENISRTQYVGPGNLVLGARYQFNRKFGVRGIFAHNKFQNNSNEMGLEMFRVGVQGVYNLGKDVLPYYITENVGVQTHFGLGYARATPIQKGSTEQIGNIMMGIRPMIKLTNGISLYFDGSYILNLKQHYSYSGVSLSPNNNESTTGAFATLSMGLMISLGDKILHADWY